MGYAQDLLNAILRQRETVEKALNAFELADDNGKKGLVENADEAAETARQKLKDLNAVTGAPAKKQTAVAAFELIKEDLKTLKNKYTAFTLAAATQPLPTQPQTTPTPGTPPKPAPGLGSANPPAPVTPPGTSPGTPPTLGLGSAPAPPVVLPIVRVSAAARGIRIPSEAECRANQQRESGFAEHRRKKEMGLAWYPQTPPSAASVAAPAVAPAVTPARPSALPFVPPGGGSADFTNL